jgi:ERCC4-type nuclease
MNDIILDTREKHENSESACLKQAFDKYGISYTLKMIPVGDILIINKETGHTLAIERKAIEDFVLSTMNGRLHSEIEKLNETYERSILIVEGSWDTYIKKRAKLKRAKFVKNAYFFTSAHKMGIMSSISLRTNTKIIQTVSMDETIALVNSLCAKFEDGRIFTVPMFKRAKTEEKIYLNLLISFPGISEAKAERIIEKYPTWVSFSVAILNKTFELEKIGEKTIEMFYKTLSL